MNWRIPVKDVTLLVIDIQERLFPVIFENEKLERKASQMIQGCRILGIPIYFSEQYPKGLGSTLQSLRQLSPESPVFTKKVFSAGEFAKEISQKHVLLIGIETHVCVRQTAHDFLDQDKIPHLIVDATSSRNLTDKQVALDELKKAKVNQTTVESVLFELMETADHPQFKAISSLIK